MDQQITPPLPPRVIAQHESEATFVIENCFPGYGVTLGNSLQRVLLSSLVGGAIIAVKIEGVDHEFMTMPSVMEDVITIILNLKKVRLGVSTRELIRGTLSVGGDKQEKEVTAKQFKFPSDVIVINPTAHIATLTSAKAHLKMEVIVEQGLGYRTAAENKQSHVLEAGMMAVDSIFSPVQKVNYRIDNMRVGERTDYNRLTLTIKTDGSVTPLEALLKANQLLVDQFSSIRKVAAEGGVSNKKQEKGDRTQKVKKDAVVKGSENGVGLSEDIRNAPLRDLKLSARINNILEESHIATVGQLVDRGEATLGTIPGIGEKAVKEIRRKLGRLGFILTK